VAAGAWWEEWIWQVKVNSGRRGLGLRGCREVISCVLSLRSHRKWGSLFPRNASLICSEICVAIYGGMWCSVVTTYEKTKRRVHPRRAP
jgi:hypothetical protein